MSTVFFHLQNRACIFNQMFILPCSHCARCYTVLSNRHNSITTSCVSKDETGDNFMMWVRCMWSHNVHPKSLMVSVVFTIVWPGKPFEQFSCRTNLMKVSTQNSWCFSKAVRVLYCPPSKEVHKNNTCLILKDCNNDFSNRQNTPAHFC